MKELKEKIDELQKTLQQKDDIINDVQDQYEEVKFELNKVKQEKEQADKSKVTYSNVEEEIIAKTLSLPDINLMYRIFYTLQAQIQQRLYVQAMSQSNLGMALGSNGHSVGEGEQTAQNPEMFTNPNPLMASSNYGQNGVYQAATSTQYKTKETTK